LYISIKKLANFLLFKSWLIALETGAMFIILSQLITWGGRLTGYSCPSYRYPGATPARIKEYSSEEKLLIKEEIRKMVKTR